MELHLDTSTDVGAALEIPVYDQGEFVGWARVIVTKDWGTGYRASATFEDNGGLT